MRGSPSKSMHILRYDTDYVHYFLNLKKNEINQQIAHILHIWLFVYTLHTSSTRRTNNDFCRFVWFWLFAHWRSFILFFSAIIIFSSPFRFTLIRFCIGWLAYTHGIHCAASRTENCINNQSEKKCSRERLLHEYSYGLDGLGIALHALMPPIKLLRL